MFDVIWSFELQTVQTGMTMEEKNFVHVKARDLHDTQQRELYCAVRDDPGYEDSEAQKMPDRLQS
ncbi:hypothetical protein N7462_011211 [Penicillium macrosclerotiorum]|uniref:uncharacterized protein n=1 Tax=Penicillium macrosclerotiorum TaxID=303699 RepID=UPI0025467B21|nr:uncharacterized protein N7462_011211 [Penicillium macrosclerotiorum]KAJ5666802.1 hypothetical protein N7462_011211 [Penicillium macrosclerotiorum]